MRIDIMNTALAKTPANTGPLALYVRVKTALDGVPWSLVVIPMRLAAFSVFWRSGSVKLEDWDSTLDLFANEYKVPLLPPDIAAYMATAMELGCSTLILLGLGTRFAALGLIGMISVIQIFVYPMAWPDHIQWLAFLIPLVLRGGGRYSVDRLIGRVLRVA
jgi:putative oxidoreductase